MSGGSDGTQSAPAHDAEPQSKWEAFKEKVGETVSSMRENAREEVSYLHFTRRLRANSRCCIMAVSATA